MEISCLILGRWLMLWTRTMMIPVPASILCKNMVILMANVIPKIRCLE